MNISGYIIRLAILLIAIAFTLKSTVLAVTPDISLPQAKYVDHGLGPLDGAYRDLINREGQTQAIKSYQDRLSQLNELSRIIVETLDSTNTLMLTEVLPGEGATKPMANIRSAADIIAAYEVAFAAPLSTKGLSDRDVDFLKNHYTCTTDLLTQYICGRGRVAVALNGESATPITELCVVIPFLNRPDTEWSREDCKALPDWLREEAQAKRLEFFSLRIGRPYSAYHIHNELLGGKEAVEGPSDLTDYLFSASKQLEEANEYLASINVLRVAASGARDNANHSAEAKAQLQIAEILDSIGHTQLAAEEVLKVLDRGVIEPDHYGRASVLRLKYLYHLKNTGLIVEEYPEYSSDSRCDPYRPQLMYIMWVALRHENLDKEASVLEDEFLTKYPDHPLLPDIHFSQAMSAMARSEYHEADRLLEIIEYRFPGYHNIDQVNNLRRRLASSNTD